MDAASTDETAEKGAAAGEASRFPLAIRSQRVLQIALGLFWILDAAQATPYVSMVWQVPVAGGPLAIQPPDIQIVEAAIMQSQGTAG